MFGDSKGNGPSGLEMALRSMGLASVLDAAKALAESGAVQKILKFADDLEGINVKETNERLRRLEEHFGITQDAGTGGVQPEGQRLLTGDVEPRSASGNG